MMRKLPECIKSLWAMSASVRWRLWITVILGIIRIVSSLGFVWASKHLVDIATKVSTDSMSRGIAIFVGILAVQIACLVFGHWWFSYSSVKTQNHIREQLFAHALRSRWEGRERFLTEAADRKR